MKGDALDPKALIREAYRIAGISEAECRSVFLDWTMSLPEDQSVEASITELIERHAQGNADHAMTEILQEGLCKGQPARRRGGWRGRRGKSPY